MTWPFPQAAEAARLTIDKIENFLKPKIMIEEPKNAWPFPTGEKPVTITERASALGVRFAHLNDFRGTVATVAYRPCNMNKPGKMLEVAVAYKHPNDQYCKKTGAMMAAERFLAGRTICMPLRGESYYDTFYNLEKTFVEI